MHPQRHTPPARVYWTQQAKDALTEAVSAHAVAADQIGADIALGTHTARLEDDARAIGAGRINRQMVQDYFARIGGRK